MGYVICEKCGGYYELEDGESIADFDTCQCGGNLSYMEKIPRETEGKYKSKDRPKLICSNCMKEHEEGIFCSKCGGKLIAVKKGIVVSNIKNFQESKELEKLSRRAFSEEKINKDDFNGPKNLFERINWLGVLAGTGFFVISMVIVGLILFLSFVSRYSYDYSGFAVAFIIAMILGLLLAIASGVLTAYVSRSRDYVDGLINGFLVGLISSVVIGLIGGILTIIIGIIIFGALTAVGGTIGIFVRRQMNK